MTTAAHTPGPWETDGQFIVAPDPSGRRRDIYLAEIVEADQEGSVATPEQRRANANLIAAAPELLALAKFALPYLEGQGQEYLQACATVARAQDD